MTVPPFPSQDLAKLVLGYLAEEQLMTAYDEFLQASPYLDALHNEFDRIFMTSLRNILAEYRAIKIYVETCKPFLLRKKLFQCANLFEIVKFLVNHIDVDKIHAQESSDKTSYEKQNITHSVNSSGCDACDALKLATCACKSKQNYQRVANAQLACQVEEEMLHNSVETTSLSDLPGNHVTSRKKQVRVLEKGSILLQSSSSNGHINGMCLRESPAVQSTISFEKNYSSGDNTQLGVRVDNSTAGLNVVKVADELESRHEIKEFNHVLKTVCNNTTVVDSNDTVSQNIYNSIPCANTFHDFASGVRGSENANVPDSSTSENSNVQAPATGDKGANSENGHTQIFIKVEPVQSNSQTHKDDTCNAHNSYITYPRIKPKPEEQRIKILSDVKVDNGKDQQTVHLLRNTTSTPLMPMQTIFINGKPAYRTHSLHPQNQNYTKDEIMAMPTIIVVPTSGPPVVPTDSLPQPVKANTNTSTSKTTLSTAQNCCNRFLGPLVIDVSSNPSVSSKQTADATIATSVKVSNETSLDGLVDAVKCGTSLPKDNTITCSAETSTPLVLPPSRKSSSTPRRTSHVRILDFTTPRRILHETINEQVPINSDGLAEVVSRQPNLIVSGPDNTNINEISVTIKSEIEVSNIDSVKENNSTNLPLTTNKRNWDADLRALAIGYASASKTNARSKSKNPRKKRGLKKSCENGASEPNDGNATQKPKKSKKKQVIEDEDEIEDVTKTNIVPVKPTINIISGTDYGALCTVKKENDKQLENQIKPSNEERVETPENDRISLQNVIGAKLNISELLETPYKQAFYDIQMDTPKYLGPDLPDDPMSDIKIMNIPTPRFFDSPKLPQATPSSYSSRPTDYSSGGSYYKPDDQDYQPTPDLRCPVTSSKQDEIIEPTKEIINDGKKSSRPVRKCAKNVSYFKNAKIKDAEDKTDGASSCSDTLSMNSSFENKIEKDVCAKTSKDSLRQEETKPESKRRNSRKRKSPVTKEKPKTFMKIKPRRTTPIKEFIGGNSRGRKRTSQSSPKLFKHRMTSKDKSNNVVVNSAPTKSRRKSSTPRKLHCSKTFNSESSSHDSPPDVTTDAKQNITRDTNSMSAQDSDTEQLALRWSDDDIKVSEKQPNPINDSDDISKIKEYIATTDTSKFSKETVVSVFHSDLVKRGFDIETAKIIERDLLDTPPHDDPNKQAHAKPMELMEKSKNEPALEKTLEMNSNTATEPVVNENEEDDDIEEVELSIHDCNENTENYLTFVHDDTKDITKQPPITLRDKFSMEVCIDDGVTIRLRATPFSPLFVQDPVNYINPDYNVKETEDAVNSICNIDKLYTPLKESIKAQCFEIFDSTLTSLDTPLKKSSPKRLQNEVTVTEMILEEEKGDGKEKVEAKKRKRIQCSNGSDESLNEHKKPKPDTQYLLASANIQNIDIESVLKKLHGP